MPNAPFEVLPRDLSAYKAGNTGVDYVHRLESGKPGPHVLVNALTHGNEFCGVAAVTYLLDHGIRPDIGTLTVSFANVAAYESFDPAEPLKSRQLVHNMNRIWSKAQLDGSEDSPELRRARELRPVIDAADHILDLHSTSEDVTPFWVYPGYERNTKVALAIGRPAVHLVMPAGMQSGTPLIQNGRHGIDGEGAGAALVAECGQHFKRASSELAVQVALDFIGCFGLIERELPPPQPQRRYGLMSTPVIQTTDFKFARPVIGFEVFEQGELIATDGEAEIRAPEGGCTILMPARAPIPGREAVYLAREI